MARESFGRHPWSLRRSHGDMLDNVARYLPAKSTTDAALTAPANGAAVEIPITHTSFLKT